MASAHRAAPGFWLAVVVTGAGTGLGAAALMHLLYVVQHTLWPGAGMDLLDAAARADWTRHLAILLGAGVLTSVGRLLLGRLPGTSIDVTSAIWLHAGRLPALRSLGSAVVGMGVSLGREGAPKQAGAVIANAASDRGRLSDDARRLLVACGSGASLAAAYGVPLGGALFALEVLRGELALRFVLPPPAHLADCDGRGLAVPARRADLRDPGLYRLARERRVGAAGRSGGRPRRGALCPRGGVGRPPPAERWARSRGAGARARAARR